MKKFIIIIILLLSFNITTADAKIILRDLDCWNIHDFVQLKNEDPYYGDIVVPGYYLMPFSESLVKEYMGDIFKKVEMEDDIYIPFYYDLSDTFTLFHVEEGVYFSFDSYNNFQDLASSPNLNFDPIYHNNIKYDFYLFHSLTYPKDSSPYFVTDSEITVYLSHNYSLQSILKSIKAYDYKDGDVTSNIEVYSENYSANRFTEGKYSITLFVTDSLNNKTYKTFNVTVLDDLDPIILGEDLLIISSSYELEISEIKQNIQASNYKGEDLTILVEKDDYTANKTLPGIYEVVFSSIDENNRKVSHTTMVNVIDTKNDFYTYDCSNIILEYNNNLNDDQLQSILKTVKNIQPYTSIAITSTIDEYRKGKYDVYYELYDEEIDIYYNEKLTFIFLHDGEILPIEIIDKSFPIFIFIPISIVLVSSSIIIFFYVKKRNN